MSGTMAASMAARSATFLALRALDQSTALAPKSAVAAFRMTPSAVVSAASVPSAALTKFTAAVISLAWEEARASLLLVKSRPAAAWALFAAMRAAAAPGSWDDTLEHTWLVTLPAAMAGAVVTMPRAMAAEPMAPTPEMM